MTVRCNADPAQVQLRLGRLNEPTVAPLSAFVEKLRRSHGGGECVPWFDPGDAGIAARVLILLEAPGARAMGESSVRAASRGSGMISAHNNDPTAALTYHLRVEAGLAEARTGESRTCLHWNIVPWYIGDAAHIRNPGNADLEGARPALVGLLRLLPDLRVVVPMGLAAQKGWASLNSSHPQSIAAVPSPHPSPKVINTQPGARARILRAFTIARLIAELP